VGFSKTHAQTFPSKFFGVRVDKLDAFSVHKRSIRPLGLSTYFHVLRISKMWAQTAQFSKREQPDFFRECISYTLSWKNQRHILSIQMHSHRENIA